MKNHIRVTVHQGKLVSVLRFKNKWLVLKVHGPVGSLIRP